VDAPLVHERHPVAALGLVEIRRRDEDRHALAREPDSASQNSRRETGSTPGGRLVQQQHCGLGHQRAGQRQLLLHAAAQPAGQPVA
jgi:hypothetical protein